MPQLHASFRSKRKWVAFMQRPFVHKIITFMKGWVLPGFQKIPFWDVMKFFVESLVQGIFFQRAAAMTYYIFTASIPLIMALIALLSFLGPGLQDNLLGFLQEAVPEYLWPAVYKIVNNLIQHHSGTILYLSLTLGIYLTFISVNAIVTTLNISYFDIEQRRGIKQLPISFAMVVVFLTVIIAACGIFIGANLLVNYVTVTLFGSEILYQYAIAFIKWSMLFILLYLFLAALFYFAPYNKKHFKFFSTGAFFSTILLVVLLYALNFYFSNISAYNLVYGSIGALLLIMLWLYWSCMAILIGFDLNVSISIAQAQRKNMHDKLKIKSAVRE
ncbi:MAG: YihY/virulence factor BrkB family protein [Bacteroidetes bacterium]|nr:YihY/virulence factor BrkB family protein [Bacteroidota bacterium]MCL2302880.1 YihY/virulence factor BrkB family protein [Lentimicrobiaceae bacterium]